MNDNIKMDNTIAGPMNDNIKICCHSLALLLYCPF
jgi:hypothetical protein